MKSITTILFLILLTGAGCKKKCECELIDQMPSFDQLESMNGITEISIMNCVEQSVTEGKEFIIQDDSTYQSILAGEENNPNFPNCNGYSLPVIDFTSKTLIGKWTSRWCDDTYARRFVDNGNYTYYIKVSSDAGCEHAACGSSSMNWMTIPKIEDTDKVTFEVTYKYNQCSYE